MKFKDFEKLKSLPLKHVWDARNKSGTRVSTVHKMMIVFMEEERRELEKQLGYSVDLVQINKIFRSILEGKIGLKEL